MKKLTVLLILALFLSGCAISPWTPELQAAFEKEHGKPGSCHPMWDCYLVEHD